MTKISTNSLAFLLCAALLSLSTTLRAQLKADFTLAHDTICSSVAEDFVSNPSGGTQPYQFLWNFGDGDTSTRPNPSHFYKGGTYKVRLYMLDAHFDTTSTTKTITVLASPQPNLGADKRGCSGQGVLLTTGLTHLSTINWTWVSGNDTVPAYHSDSIIVNDSGIYFVKVQDSAGCQGTGSVKVHFNPLIKTIRLDSTVCFNDSVTLHAGVAGAGASYTWIDQLHGKVVGNGPTFKFWASGLAGYGTQANFMVVISQTLNGVTCTDTGYANLVVNSPTHPILGFISLPICVNASPIQLPDADPSHKGGSWYYPKNTHAIVDGYLYPGIMGAGSAYIHYYYQNVYGCGTDDSTRIFITPLPNAHWTMNYFGDSADFHAIDSSFSSGSYFWDFGDGKTGIGGQTKHLYPNLGSYTISLRVTDPCVSSYDSVLNISKSGIASSNNNDFSFDVFPNPFHSAATLQYRLNKSSKVTISLLDVTGKQIGLIEDRQLAAGNYTLEINSEKYHLKPGIYILSFMTEDGYLSKKMVEF